MNSEESTPGLDDLGTVLAECLKSCRHCAIACLGEKHPQHMAECIRLDLDCAEACSLALGFLHRQSGRVSQALEFCAEICKACGEECAKHASMDHCRACAEVCNRCAEACFQMSRIQA
jgi:hypothetical protein